MKTKALQGKESKIIAVINARGKVQQYKNNILIVVGTYTYHKTL